MNRKKGFTLVEIMIVVAIIGLLAAMCIPNFIKARNKSMRRGCISNLEQIQAAKQQYFKAQNNRDSDSLYFQAFIPSPEDLDPYIEGGYESLECPKGGNYTIGTIDRNPDCSYEGHELEPKTEDSGGGEN